MDTQKYNSINVVVKSKSVPTDTVKYRIDYCYFYRVVRHIETRTRFYESILAGDALRWGTSSL